MAVLEPEKEIFRECVLRVIDGDQEMTLVRDLNARGIPTPHGSKWRAGNLKKMLTRRRYVIFDAAGHPADCPCLVNPEGNGTLVRRGKEHRAAWRGFVTAEVHRQLIAAFMKHSPPGGRGRAQGRTYLLTGLLVCGRCGRGMHGRGRSRPDGTYQRRYACANQGNKGELLGCGKVFRDAAALDEFVTNAVFEHFGRPETVAMLAQHRDRARVSEFNKLRKMLAQYDARRCKIIGEYDRGEWRTADFLITLAAVSKGIEETQDKLATLRTFRNGARLSRATILTREWDTSLERRREVIRVLIDRVTVHPSKPGSSHIWNGHRFNPADVTITWRPTPPP